MFEAVERITNGRVELRTQGKAEQGRIDFHDGIRLASEIFTEVEASRDSYLMLLAEYVYTAQDLAGSRPEEKEARSSCEAAIHDLDDAFNCLKIVGQPAVYQGVEQSYLHRPQFRYKDMPRDAFHLAYIGHRTRVRNSLRKIGFDPDEQTLLELRMYVFNTAQNVYLEKQQAALGENRALPLMAFSGIASK
jgi:hypothetical protein